MQALFIFFIRKLISELFVYLNLDLKVITATLFLYHCKRVTLKGDELVAIHDVLV